MEKKTQRAVIVTAILIAAAALGVGGYFILNRTQEKDEGQEDTELVEEKEGSEEDPVDVAQPDTAGSAYDLTLSNLARPSFYNAQAGLKYDADLVPCVMEYAVEADFSNIVNADRYYFTSQRTEMTDLFINNGFFVSNYAYASEFFEIYEENRYLQYPNFVTVDSLMHTYHIYFSYLLKNTEKEYLSAALSDVSAAMLTESLAQYEILKGSEWEEAAKQNVIFFAVGARLQDGDTEIPDFAVETAEEELRLIADADGVARSPLMGGDEDYSQYKPRGYYDGDEQLEQYFRTMMWYGRIGFLQAEEQADRSALLMTLAIHKEAAQKWESIYAVTSFFAGMSDDLGYYEYLPVIAEAYGETVSLEDLIGNDDAWRQFHDLTAALEPPAINSLSGGDDEETLNFRFMGQRFSIDAAIMQNLIYDAVGENDQNEVRMLPDVLDVPAALGSDTALDILAAQGDTGYSGYSENIEELRGQYNNASPELWSASLYACWLDTLRPLLFEKGEGYPFFMQNESWQQKELETFAGSYTELKHDTVLYSKQMLAEMGGGDEYEYVDDRGYVQPEPLVYAKFSLLARQTADGLASYGMISDADLENLQKLEELADQLVIISEKELLNETLTDEEYELIRGYGGTLEHFWLDAMGSHMSKEFPCPLVVDIATNIDGGSVLEIANGRASVMYVAVPVDGTIRICSGAVYTFYQFEWPLNDRLTDTQWRQMMGWELNDNNEYEQTVEMEQPDWTQEYRPGNE